MTYQTSAPAELRQRIDIAGVNPRKVIGRIPSSTLVDLFAGYGWGNYNVELFGTNIFDKRNQLSRFVVCGDICLRPGNLHVVPGRPRTIGLRAGMKF
jgi:outer membrane receptor protein involved in Fe transport